MIFLPLLANFPECPLRFLAYSGEIFRGRFLRDFESYWITVPAYHYFLTLHVLVFLVVVCEYVSRLKLTICVYFSRLKLTICLYVSRLKLTICLYVSRLKLTICLYFSRLKLTICLYVSRLTLTTCRLHLNQYHTVETITCLSKKEIELGNIRQLYGVHQQYMNSLEERFDGGLISDFFQYFRWGILSNPCPMGGIKA